MGHRILAPMELSGLLDKILARRREDGTLRIVQAGHPALRRPARPWSGQLDPERLAELVEAMTLTMRDAPGVGLAAPQVGLPLALMLLEDRIEDGDDPDGGVLRRSHLPLRVFLNPRYEGEGTRRALYWEGCLSVDGWQSIVPRHLSVAISGLERREGGAIAPVAESWTGWPARIFQHETDHLDGVLCHDRAVPRSFVESGYAARYADLPDAVRRLRLEGEITRLGPGEVELG